MSAERWLVACESKGMGPYGGHYERTVTAGDIAAWLHAHPAEAVTIVRGLKVAGPWQRYTDTYETWARMPLVYGDQLDGLDAAAVLATEDDETDGLWMAESPLLKWTDRGCFADREDAKTAADEKLRADGWSLA